MQYKIKFIMEVHAKIFRKLKWYEMNKLIDIRRHFVK